ncbi:exonuclease domain-containing protein [Arthrobacter psychrochitiniphilus]|uniref:Exonuclease n=1 Tax=Arthrobacter psychrochitiniphilus TaxID=291045 RepID=A0A2V3DUA7_9MICC|nr:exonuclease domain-containing protein [Arthrobacter psychrochitiniphilus]NYG17960.1 DNA polymerase-3 subunit epsilon [Arthrobacter psychrochitiniphilus]PXA64148.1 exonuclease [Arthrobacter psychrochitiniphilus]
MDGISFTAIDFETANNYRASACAVGLTKVKSGQVVEQVSWLMKPLPGYADFLPINVGIHGITAAHVRNMPDWRGIHGPMMDFIGGDALVGHNVSFEKSVISKANEASGLPATNLDFHCTLTLARKHLQLDHYTLSDVVGALELPAFNHHDAGDDARASALIAIELARRSGAATLSALWPEAKNEAAKLPSYYAVGYTRKLADLPPPNPQANPYGPLFGQTIVFSGDLAAMPRVQAQDASAAKGATIANSTTKKVTMVVSAEVLGGGRPSAKVKRAAELASAGQDIRIISELQFLRLLAFK